MRWETEPDPNRNTMTDLHTSRTRQRHSVWLETEMSGRPDRVFTCVVSNSGVFIEGRQIDADLCASCFRPNKRRTSTLSWTKMSRVKLRLCGTEAGKQNHLQLELFVLRSTFITNRKRETSADQINRSWTQTEVMSLCLWRSSLLWSLSPVTWTYRLDLIRVFRGLKWLRSACNRFLLGSRWAVSFSSWARLVGLWFPPSTCHQI